MTVSITPETSLERDLLADPRLRAGLEWGTPRFGRPEGRVGEHVAAMLAAIPNDDPLRGDLRFLALTHDSFKAEVRPLERWSRDNDHAIRARRFAERYTSDERLLTTLELHDEPYWIWQTADAPEEALRPLIDRLPDHELFARFVELDAANEGKDLTLLWWFRRELAIAGRLPTHPATVADEKGPDLIYAKTFATSPEQQPAVARAARELITEQRDSLQAGGEILTSDDGQRVVLWWRWHGSRRELIDRDADVVREALAAHPIFANTRAVEARIFHTANAGAKTRILIVDDDARFRAIARTLLEASGYTIAAEAADGEEAIAAVESVSPDAALVDVQLPDMDGLTLARRLHQTDGSLRIVLTSTDPTLVAPVALIQSGAVAFVPKDKLAITDLAPLLGD